MGVTGCSTSDGGFNGPLVNCLAPCVEDYLWILTSLFGSLPKERQDWDVLVGFSFVWSLIPTLIVMISGFTLILKRNTTPLVIAMLGAGSSIVNKLISLPIASAIAEQYSHRPIGGCIHGHGMPSGHTTNAYAVFTWIALELLMPGGYGSRGKLTPKQKLGFVALSAFLCLPVLPARVGIYDHTWYVYARHYGTRYDSTDFAP
jgi:membrane-associated phospholipid phosphatase